MGALSPRELRVALEHLPEKLNDTYDGCMERILSQNNKEVELARRVLLWMLYAKRPLKAKELQYALVITPENPIVDEEVLTDEKILVSLCAGMVTIDHESNVIRLAHYTTREYLEGVKEINCLDAQTTIASTCVICISAIEVLRQPRDNQVNEFLSTHPLYAYAAEYWGIHARGNAEQAIRKVIMEFLDREFKVEFISRIRQMLANGVPWQYTKPLPRICLLAFFGLADILSSLLEKGEDVTATDSAGMTALHWAAAEGHEEIVQFLLENGASVEAENATGWFTLVWAAYKLWAGIKGQFSKIVFGGNYRGIDRYIPAHRRKLKYQGIVTKSNSDLLAKHENGHQRNKFRRTDGAGVRGSKWQRRGG